MSGVNAIPVHTRNGVLRTRYRPTWADIDLAAIEYNYIQVKRMVGKDVMIMVVVKANAYGHGTVEISQVLERMGVNYLGVATTDEAVRLRDHGIKTPILILGSILPEEVKVAKDRDITITLCNREILSEIKRLARNEDPGEAKVKVHVKIDTGMGRIGVWHEDALAFIKEVSNEKCITLEGIYTHFSSAGRDEFFTNYQVESFERLLSSIEKSWIKIPLKHAANSIATVDFKRSHLNLVRPGLIIYGMYPKHTFPKIIKLKPAMSLKTKIVFIKDIPAGRSISYGRTFISQKPTKVATLPIGYADGYHRGVSNKASVLVRGQFAPVVGKVTMDQTMIDVGQINGVKIGDEVVLIGKQGHHEIRVEQLSRLAGTIAYDFICGISNRVPRIYK
jgi:alanine racemase